MNAVEQIKAEIERRIKEDYNGPDQHDNEIAQGACASIIAFLDTLPKEKPSEDLEKELDKWRHHHFAGERDGLYSGEYLLRDSQLDIARHFAEWQKNKMLAGAVDGEIVKGLHGLKCVTSTPIEGCEFGEKVGVIIIKKN